jgi:hypothetical protein
MKFQAHMLSANLIGFINKILRRSACRLAETRMEIAYFKRDIGVQDEGMDEPAHMGQLWRRAVQFKHLRRVL